MTEEKGGEIDMAAVKLNWSTLFPKILSGIFLAMLGIVFGNFSGVIFEGMNILTNLPWMEMLTFLGAITGFVLGTQIDL